MDIQLQRQICARIKQARKRAGLTQQEMADLLDLTLRGYQNYEDDRVPFKRLSEIAKLTGVEESWLLHGEAATSQEALLEGVEAALALLRSIDGHLVRIEQAIPEPAKSRASTARRRS